MAIFDRAGAAQPAERDGLLAGQGVSTASFYLWRKRLGADIEQPQSVPTTFLDLGELGADAGAGADRTGGWEVELALGDALVLRLRRR